MSAANDNQKRMTTAAELAAKTGRTPRYFQNLASTGEIDWAWQPGGEGCRWMFDLHGFENWLEAGRANKWLKTFTNAAKSGGRKRSTKALGTGSALKQRLSEKLKRALPGN
jgi:hypothetical protein